MFLISFQESRNCSNIFKRGRSTPRESQARGGDISETVGKRSKRDQNGRSIKIQLLGNTHEKNVCSASKVVKQTKRRINAKMKPLVCVPGQICCSGFIHSRCMTVQASAQDLLTVLPTIYLRWQQELGGWSCPCMLLWMHPCVQQCKLHSRGTG